MTDRELMQQALDALLRVWHSERNIKHSEAINALRARLAQPEHKPADVFLFLLGEGELDGAKFGERHPTERGNYWWRKHLRAVLAQPEPEPVAQVDYNERGNIQWLFGKQIPDKTFLYTCPPQREWQGLTDEEIRGFEIWLDEEEEKHGWNPPADIVKYMETKLKEKNHD